MQAVKILLPVYFLAKFDTSYSPRRRVNGSLNLRHLHNRRSCVIKDAWARFVYRIKPLRHVQNVIMMVNNAGDVFKLCISTKGKQKLSNLFLFLERKRTCRHVFVTKTILHTYRNEINTVNQLQLNYSTNIHLLIPWFMENSCVITLKLNTLTDVLYEMTVGGGICLRMWKRPRRPRYNGVAVYIYVMNSLGTEDDWK